MAPSTAMDMQPKLTRKQRINSLIRCSKMLVNSQSDFFSIKITGPLSKIPSVANNRLAMIPKKKLYAQIQSRDLGALSSSLNSLRPVVTKNPAHAESLEALTELWQVSKPDSVHTIPASKDDRLMCLLLCGDELNRTDSHNVIKAASDWLQQIGVYANDLHVDFVALRSRDYATDSAATFLIVIPQRDRLKLLSTAFKAAFDADNYLKRIEI